MGTDAGKIAGGDYWGHICLDTRGKMVVLVNRFILAYYVFSHYGRS
jgi:hypothetical protein